MTKLLSITEVADTLHLSRQTIGRMLESGSLPGFIVRSGKRKKVWRVREEVLEQWIVKKEEETKKIVQGSRENRKFQVV